MYFWQILLQAAFENRFKATRLLKGDKMIGFYIIAAILLLILILFYSPFKIYVVCEENKLTAVVKYLFFKKTLYPRLQQKKADENKTGEKNKPNEKDSEENNGKKKKKSIIPKDKDEKIDFFINVLKASGKFLKFFTKRITIKKLRADIDISDEDACDCAIKFGKFNIFVYNILSLCGVFFNVKKDHININCVYNKPESVFNYSFIVSFTPAAGILSIFAFIFTFLVNNRNNRRRRPKIA